MPEKKLPDELSLDTPREPTINNAADSKSTTETCENDLTNVEWSPDNEQIMIEWCDVGQCYKWLNYRSHSKLSTMHAWFTIPAIVLSTISGTASFAQESFPDHIKSYAPAIIGSINIFIGILTTIQQYLKISELNEAHRVSAISWDKFARNIRIELAKKPAERDKAGNFLKQCRQEFDRLMETSPSINDNVIDEFISKFSGKPGTDKRLRFERLRKPDICDTIVSVDETRNKWYEQLAGLPTNFTDKANDAAVRARDNFILEQKQLLEEKEAELARHLEMQQISVRVQLESVGRAAQLRKVQETFYNEQVDVINTYIAGYKNIYLRKPTVNELKEYFVNEVTPDILNRFLETYSQTE